MNVSIITVGKLKESYFKEASAEYEKRLSAYCKLKIIEIEPIKLAAKPLGTVHNALESEAAHINRNIPKAYIIALDSGGEKFTSEKFADKLLKIERDLCFIIGSSEGLAESVKQSANLKLSLSDMTFPHRLARIMLLEQIYRAFSINNNGKYHK